MDAFEELKQLANAVVAKGPVVTDLRLAKPSRNGNGRNGNGKAPTEQVR